MAFISVIVPFRGNEPYLARCIDSLFIQRYPTWKRELIFVDSGGDVAARAVVARHPSLRVLHEPERHAALSAGVRTARGDVIAFTDADCAAAPDWLASIAAGLADPSVHLLVGCYLPARDSFTAAALAAWENEKYRHIFNSPDGAPYCANTRNMAVRTRLLRELGGSLPWMHVTDEFFGRAVVERYGRDAVRWVPNMAVRHLEIGGALDYCRKAFARGRSGGSLEWAARQWPLDRSERLIVFRRTVRKEAWSPLRAAALYAVLAAATLASTAGAMVKRRAATEAEPSPVVPGMQGTGTGAGPRLSGVGPATTGAELKRAI